PEDIEDALRELKAHGKTVPLVAKLARRNAVDTLDDILKLADAVMVARGDLCLECPRSEVPIIQKRIIRAARHAPKASIVATQMLLSMVRNPIPTRAEATDVANAILDGADCVMLSEDTEAGEHPVAAVKFIDEVAKHAEQYFRERLKQPYFPADASSSAKYLAYSAALIAPHSGARAIASHSQLGSTARRISSRRPA
ncbi:pyruvate kinase, partial [Oceanidesulfovibrio marinus]